VSLQFAGRCFEDAISPSSYPLPPLPLTPLSSEKAGRNAPSCCFVVRLWMIRGLLSVLIYSLLTQATCFQPPMSRLTRLSPLALPLSGSFTRLLSSSTSSIFDHLLPIASTTLPQGQCIALQLPSPSSITSASRTSPVLTINNLAATLIFDAPLLSHDLHPAELRYCKEKFNISKTSSSSPQASSFLLGRVALRQCLAGLISESSPSKSSKLSSLSNDEASPYGPLLKDKHGRVSGLPEGYTASISHKQDVACALVSKTFNKLSSTSSSGDFHVGVDVERCKLRKSNATSKTKLQSRLLTPQEILSLTDSPLKSLSTDCHSELMLRFSLKESLYKALHPIVGHYIGFQEVEITPFDDGTATVEFKFKEEDGSIDGDGRWKDGGELVQYTMNWRKIKGGDGVEYFLTSAGVWGVGWVGERQ
jgi:phosphopantetheine--protein transferase-like protein